MPHADHDENHEGDGARFAEDVNQNPNNGLSDVAFHGFVEILDGEEESDKKKESED